MADKITRNGHGQSGWSPIGCEGFHTNLNIPSPLPIRPVRPSKGSNRAGPCQRPRVPRHQHTAQHSPWREGDNNHPLGEIKHGIEHVQHVSTICGCPLAIDTINQIHQKNKTLLDLLVVCQSWHHQKHNTSSVYFGISQKLLTRQPRLNRLNQVALVRSNLPVACSPKRS